MMSHTMEPLGRSMFAQDTNFVPSGHVPILPSSTSNAAFSQPEAMDITPPASVSGALQQNSGPDSAPEAQKSRAGTKQNADNASAANGTSANSSPATASQQPKVVQTAFIHKLYRYRLTANIEYV